MLVPIGTVSALLTFAAGSFASPMNAAEALAARSAPGNTVRINSSSDFCMIVPKNPHTNIGDSERPGGETSYCSKPGAGQGKMPAHFWTKVAYKKTTGVHGKPYVQLTGCINPNSLDRLNPGGTWIHNLAPVADLGRQYSILKLDYLDDGGQYDSSGGAGGQGNPQGSTCTGNEFNAEYHEERVREIDGEDEPDADEERTFRLVGPTTESHAPGHAVLSPLINISLGSSINEGYAEDGVAIEIDASEVNANNVNGDAMVRYLSPQPRSCDVPQHAPGRLFLYVYTGHGTVKNGPSPRSTPSHAPSRPRATQVLLLSTDSDVSAVSSPVVLAPHSTRAFSFLLESMQANGLRVFNINPVLTA
ncbi:hypothetical protein FRB98_002153 [Tulasnella sp. 332]|nr:hypothetical protein FRB98_002153 [Tulasnella sp. 332]